MSFFKDLKDDIGAAVDELASDATGIPSEDVTENTSVLDEAEDDEPVQDSELDEFDLSDDDSVVDSDMLGKILEAEAAEAAETVPEAAEPATEVSEPAADILSAPESSMSAVEGHLPVGATAPIISSELEAPEFASVDSGKSTVIAKGTVINGSVVSDGSLEVYGTVKGDINCLGKLSIAGSVIGNSTASEVYINTDRLDGGITSKGSVKIGVGTVVIGDITASSLVIAGAVKGEIDVNGPVVVDSTAVVKGNINSKGIQVNNGAVIDGFCALPYASVDIDSVFDNAGDKN